MTNIAFMRWALVLLVMAACRPRADAAVDAAASGPAATSAPSSTSSTSTPKSPSARDALEGWESAESALDATALSKTYADRVKYYGADLSREDCVKRARDFFAKSPKQTFAKAEIVTQADHADATVEKTVTLAGKATPYVQHVALALDAGAWHVTEETDETTEKNLAASSKHACERALRALTDGETDGYDEVSVTIAQDTADITYWGKIDMAGGGATEPHATPFHVNLAAGTVTRDRMNRVGDRVESEALKPDPAKLAAARAACKR